MKKDATMKIKVNIMRKSLLLITSFLLATSCTKEEFAPIKSPQNSTVNALASTSTSLCSQSTLVSPKVDVLLLWDNSSSSLFINPAVKASFSSLIDNISEKFDYHILSAPLISTNSSNSLYEASLVTKDISSVSGLASGIIKTKDQAGASLLFTPASGSYEPGIDRVTSIIEANRANGIFRNDAYTIIVLMSNGDDTSCEIAKGYSSCATADWMPLMQTKIDKLLCLRGNVNGPNCSGTTTLNSTMMRVINISALTSCSSGLGKVNSRYRKVSKSIYEASYTNGWPTSNDDLTPFKTSDGTPYPDSYDICSIDFNHIFDGVNSAIKQTLIKHVYEFWPVPVVGDASSFDPDTLIVVRDDGKKLVNRSSEANPVDGFKYIGDQTNHNTRSIPTAGENYTGKMIQLFGVENNDKIVYPHCLTITYDALKLQYGYIYLKNGEPYVPSIVVNINGNIVPQSTTNGWSYMGQQSISSLDPNLKVVDLPGNTTSGYILQLNGSYKFNNTAGASISVNVAYTSKAN